MHSLDHQNVLECEYIQEAHEKFYKNFIENKDFTNDKDAKYNIVTIEPINENLEGLIVNLLIEGMYMSSPKCIQFVL
jgi:hypothetical protein